MERSECNLPVGPRAEARLRRMLAPNGRTADCLMENGMKRSYTTRSPDVRTMWIVHVVMPSDMAAVCGLVVLHPWC
jgi:hypothetical protein